MFRSSETRGVCSVCGSEFLLTLAGLVRSHGEGRSRVRSVPYLKCPGSDMAPADAVVAHRDLVDELGTANMSQVRLTADALLAQAAAHLRVCGVPAERGNCPGEGVLLKLASASPRVLWALVAHLVVEVARRDAAGVRR